ncbi:phenylalanine--tRNA ligase subunit beta [Sulfurirhabdus autotrophica]|uniref:Phenylalanine--tRNA ligase beta subunit n=1 Tax=Sulfurirhabdus autotrophica TaxID=1706046 RepID=A0A4R3YE96_9PROT|nr:phenylalanine--tRNA ligase subunit beta [Sulfurirhabdus autotrophica]TCV90380.1 phenylalanyl-tRNA synthetase beta subunit [Sulfurirhabdus autotrophica]
MKFSENWLRTLVNPEVTSEQLAHALTMSGLEVEALESLVPDFNDVVIGEVLSLEKHPDADRLQVCKVNVGADAPLQIVCGAKNVHVGARVPCAQVGAALPGIVIKQAKVRGVESSGMLCSEKEIGLAEESDGLLLLPSDAPVGQNIREYLDLNDKLFTLKLTPNRGDCLSVTGVAREVSAITASSLILPEVTPAVIDKSAGVLDVKVLEPEACPRYCGRIVRGVNLAAPTPEWMIRRLERSGLRSINAIVNVTNYVLLELGQPLHAFDLNKLNGGITVRFATQDEQLTLLNEQAVKLAENMLVIADDATVLALAGIMGGLDSAVSDTTTDIFLESAFFNPAVIAGKSRSFAISSDSSFRFERGVDFASTRIGLERATCLIQEICGGAAGEITEVISELPKRDPIQLRVARARRVLGIDMQEDQVEALLRLQQLTFVSDKGVYFVTPPSYRFDLNIEADLIEELVRLYGYDNVKAVSPRANLGMLPKPESFRQDSELRQVLVNRDFQEVINYSFVDEVWEKDFAGNTKPIKLQNPIASHMSTMRSTLLGGLIDGLRFNLNRKQERVRLFELGRCFVGDQPSSEQQPLRIAGLCYGPVRSEQWGEPARSVDYYDMKADVEALCWPEIPRFTAAQHPALHPGQSATVWIANKCIGWIGVLHPQWQQKYDLPQSATLFELDLASLQKRVIPVFSEYSKLQQVRRDIAVVVDESLSVQIILDALHENKPAIVTALELFDVYRGKGIDSDKKSLAFRVLMQDTQKTLTDKETDEAITHLTQILNNRFNAKLRT